MLHRQAAELGRALRFYCHVLDFNMTLRNCSQAALVSAATQGERIGSLQGL